MSNGESHRLGACRARDVVRGEALLVVLVRRTWIAEDVQWLYAVLHAHRHSLVNSGGNTVLAFFALDIAPLEVIAYARKTGRVQEVERDVPGVAARSGTNGSRHQVRSDAQGSAA